MDFKGIDLNLLAAFDALMREQNVTRAAVRAGVSQPAMSAALSRLRTLCADPLFVRSGRGLLPTTRARELAEPLQRALAQIETTLTRAPEFSPGTSESIFRLGLSDYAVAVLLVPLLQALEQQAPGIVLHVHGFEDRDRAVALLDSGDIDAAVGVAPSRTGNRICTAPILSDTFVTIVAHDNPEVAHGLNMAAFLRLPHALASPEGDHHGIVDTALARQGRRRRLVLTVPEIVAVPHVVAHTGMIATLLKRVALQSAERRRLLIFPPPLDLPDISFHLIWHRRSDPSQAQQWLRSLIESTAATV